MSHSFSDYVHTGSETQPSYNPMISEANAFPWDQYACSGEQNTHHRLVLRLNKNMWKLTYYPSSSAAMSVCPDNNEKQ